MQFVASLYRLLLRLGRFLLVAPFLTGWLLVWIGLGVIISTFVSTILIFGIWNEPPGERGSHWLVLAPLMVLAAVVALHDWTQRTGVTLWWDRTAPDSHGSARFATRKERAGYQKGDGLLIGRDTGSGKLLRYDGPAHLLTLAPTRAGKGVGTVIPNLLTTDRSVLVIDPKGENARIAGEARWRFGRVHVLDPFGVTGMPSSAYNPLDRLSATSLDLGEDAASLAEALVMDPPGQVSEAHWNEEAKALLSGLIMFAVAHEDYGRKTLATVREYLTLPPNRLDAYSRWLRLLVAQALQDIARDAEASQGTAERLSAPTLFLLDEFAALGRLEAVERAMGLMAGYGLQLWPILQDMSQLKDLYAARANTFVANAGVLQTFGVNDFETAKWLSQMIGRETTGYQSQSHKPGDVPSVTSNVTARDLMTPDEIMQIPADMQLLRIQGQPTIAARKLRFFADREFDGLYTPKPL